MDITDIYITLHEDFPVGTVDKNTPVNARDIRDTGLIPGSGRSPRGGHGNPLQNSCPEHLQSNRLGRGEGCLVGYSP